MFSGELVMLLPEIYIQMGFLKNVQIFLDQYCVPNAERQDRYSFNNDEYHNVQQFQDDCDVIFLK